MRKGMAYLEAAEKCRDLARKTTEPQIKKELDAVAAEWQALAAKRAKQISKQGKCRLLTSRQPSRRSGAATR